MQLAGLRLSEGEVSLMDLPGLPARSTVRSSDKLDFKKLGPFVVKEKISMSNYILSLSKTMQIHSVFHISLLEPAPKSAKEQQGCIEIDI